MKSIAVIIILLNFFILSPVYPQKDAGKILKAVSEKLSKIENYTADVLVKIDVETIKIKDRKAKVIFRKPDKFEFKSDGFILLPKNSGQGDFLKLLNQQSTALYVSEEIINKIKTSLVKIIPTDPGSDVILAELWVDVARSLVVKMKTYTKQNGSYTVNFFYAMHPFDLPDKIVVEFDLKGIKLPAKLSGDLEDLSKHVSKGNTKGKVTLYYSNYVVNK
ncbi:MAG TPA: hypothetical protein P5050_01815 [Bacteroidia bacterium]|nr:hypothetical protein [Bacteroidia bacterium]HRS57939.1 hypothetical protein [Bacteroidia bacterium]HRU67982.1 hypothetical protein [Bacteroidia bacterium]